MSIFRHRFIFKLRLCLFLLSLIHYILRHNIRSLLLNCHITLILFRSNYRFSNRFINSLNNSLFSYLFGIIRNSLICSFHSRITCSNLLLTAIKLVVNL